MPYLLQLNESGSLTLPIKLLQAAGIEPDDIVSVYAADIHNEPVILIKPTDSRCNLCKTTVFYKDGQPTNAVKIHNAKGHLCHTCLKRFSPFEPEDKKEQKDTEEIHA